MTLSKKEGIKVISQTEFYAQDSTTNVEENEYVQLASGVYMQIVDKGSENAADTVKTTMKCWCVLWNIAFLTKILHCPI